jgi:hypothetical protein
VALSEKQCWVCEAEKPLGDFYPMAGMRDGHRNECKDCLRAQHREWYRKNRDRSIAYVKSWQQTNAERLNAYRREYNARPERRRKQRDAYYRRTFGISADDFDALVEAQGGGCAICAVVPERVASLHLDHDHVTGAIRGVLCLSCNQALGHFRDDAELLERAAAYVRGGRAMRSG